MKVETLYKVRIEHHRKPKYLKINHEMYYMIYTTCTYGHLEGMYSRNALLIRGLGFSPIQQGVIWIKFFFDVISHVLFEIVEIILDVVYMSSKWITIFVDVNGFQYHSCIDPRISLYEEVK